MTATPKKTKPETAAANPGMPLFFKEPMALSLDRHGKSALQPVNTYEFARNTNSLPISALEASEAAKSYPIVFTEGDQVMPVVLVGLQQTNNFIDKKGAWEPHAYIPAYVRKYPFIFLEVPEEEKFVLCIDEAAPHYSAKGGAGTTALYEDGKPSALTQNALNFCSAYQEQYKFTRDFCDKMKELDLLSPHKSNVELPGGKKLGMGGFQLLDQEKLNKLADKDILALYKAGYMPVIHFALQSLSNWQRLLELEPKE